MNTTLKFGQVQEAEQIGSICRALRAMHGMTQDDLAKRMGVTRPTLRAIEYGSPTASKYLTTVCTAFGIKLGDMDLLLDLLVNSRRNMEEWTDA